LTFSLRSIPAIRHPVWRPFSSQPLIFSTKPNSMSRFTWCRIVLIPRSSSFASSRNEMRSVPSTLV